MAYDPSTDAGFVRLKIADTLDAPNQIFSDAEIEAFLSRAGDDVYRASASALRAIVADRARLSKRIERQGYKSEQHAIKDLLDLASSLEEESGTALGLEVGTIETPDNVFESYRPGWRDTDADPEVGS